MNETPIIQVVMDDFPGMFSNADSRDVPQGGAQVQVNIGTLKPGQLTTRGGMWEVTFDTLTG